MLGGVVVKNHRPTRAFQWLVWLGKRWKARFAAAARCGRGINVKRTAGRLETRQPSGSSEPEKLPWHGMGSAAACRREKMSVPYLRSTGTRIMGTTEPRIVLMPSDVRGFSGCSGRLQGLVFLKNKLASGTDAEHGRETTRPKSEARRQEPTEANLGLSAGWRWRLGERHGAITSMSCLRRS